MFINYSSFIKVYSAFIFYVKNLLLCFQTTTKIHSHQPNGYLLCFKSFLLAYLTMLFVSWFKAKKIIKDRRPGRECGQETLWNLKYSFITSLILVFETNFLKANHFLIVENSKKWNGAKSGKYEICSINWNLHSCSFVITIADFCNEALSWWHKWCIHVSLHLNMSRHCWEMVIRTRLWSII